MRLEVKSKPDLDDIVLTVSYFLINGENVNSDPGTDSPQPSPSTVLMKDY